MGSLRQNKITKTEILAIFIFSLLSLFFLFESVLNFPLQFVVKTLGQLDENGQVTHKIRLISAFVLSLLIVVMYIVLPKNE
tara:strand:- start:1392 stop:1634 length:243 start_codon:yes stop_codon:yes gene_type:complete